MKGYRTLLFNLLAAVLTVLAAYNWGDIIPPQYAWVGAIVVAVSNVFLRVITTTPVGTKS